MHHLAGESAIVKVVYERIAGRGYVGQVIQGPVLLHVYNRLLGERELYGLVRHYKVIQTSQ